MSKSKSNKKMKDKNSNNNKIVMITHLVSNQDKILLIIKKCILTIEVINKIIKKILIKNKQIIIFLSKVQFRKIRVQIVSIRMFTLRYRMLKIYP